MAHFRPLVKRFPPVRRLHWKKRKTLAAINNRRQWEREFDVTASSAVEIEMEHLAGYYLATQSSTASVPNYIITE
tara:strand:- start:117 stop:341 length:225 start_codon:yes stop_codon:yes gene_type:complete